MVKRVQLSLFFVVLLLLGTGCEQTQKPPSGLQTLQQTSVEGLDKKDLATVFESYRYALQTQWEELETGMYEVVITLDLDALTTVSPEVQEAKLVFIFSGAMDYELYNVILQLDHAKEYIEVDLRSQGVEKPKMHEVLYMVDQDKFFI